MINYCNIWDRENDGSIKTINNWLTPAKEMLPGWYDELKVNKDMPNVKTCTSFTETFKNSLIYSLPQDLKLTWEDVWEDDQPMIFMGEDHDMYNLIKCESHTSFLGDDLMGNFSDRFHNVKIDSNLLLKSDSGRQDLIFMDTFYYEPIAKFRVAQGPLPILDNKEVCLNVNLWVPKVFKELTIPKNTPIAMLYFPMGIPEFEYKKIEITEREHTVGDYQVKLNKCPYGHG